MKGIASFIQDWDKPSSHSKFKKIKLRQSSLGNINYNGSLDTGKGPSISNKNILFEKSLEKGVKSLVLNLIETFGCITYTSCEGHYNLVTKKISERHVGILPRDGIDNIRILEIFAVCWERVIKLKSKYSSIDFGISRNILSNRRESFHVLDFYIAKKARFSWKRYFSEVDAATDEICNIFNRNNLKIQNCKTHNSYKRIKEKYLNIKQSDFPLNYFPYKNSKYCENILKIHVDQNTDQSSRRKTVNDFIFSWFDENIGGFSSKSVFHPLCGPGIEAVSIRQFGCLNYLGIDYSKQAVFKAQRTFSNNPTYQFIVKDILKIDKWRMKFDLGVLSYEALNAFIAPERRIILKKIKRSLNNQGRLVGDIRLQNKSNLPIATKIITIDLPSFLASKDASPQGLEVDSFDGRTSSLSKNFFSVHFNPLRIKPIYRYSFWLPTLEEFNTFMKKLGFKITNSKILLKNTDTDLIECKNNLFFIAILNK